MAQDQLMSDAEVFGNAPPPAPVSASQQTPQGAPIEITIDHSTNPDFLAWKAAQSAQASAPRALRPVPTWS